MPTKRQFDMVVLVVLLSQPVKGLFRMWATRKTTDNNTSTAGQIVSGAVRIAT